MDQTGVIERVRHIAAVVDDPAGDADVVTSGLVAIREARAWLDAQQAAMVSALRVIDSFPEHTLADTDRTSVGSAAKTTERSDTLGSTPKLAAALADGAITAGHVDAVTRAGKKLGAEKRGALLDRADALTDVARAGTVDEFARRIDNEARRLQESDGMDRLERQRRNVRARSWVDPDGMWKLLLTFDPLTGARIASRIDAVVEALFAEAVPEECPTDPIEKQRYLAAQATARLLLDDALADHTHDHSRTGHEADSVAGDAVPPPRSTRSTRPGAGRPEFVAVIDADAPGGFGPVAEFSIPVEIPARVLAELGGGADIHAVVVRNGVVLHAPGELDLGRTTRLANRAQRRALRGLYRGCAIPGCTVGYDRCKLHHIIFWRHGGRTDLDNLLPVCSMHHGRIHNDDWIIELGPHRELTLRLPDGSVRTSPPPGRRQPAA